MVKASPAWSSPQPGAENAETVGSGGLGRRFGHLRTRIGRINGSNVSNRHIWAESRLSLRSMAETMIIAALGFRGVRVLDSPTCWRFWPKTRFALLVWATSCGVRDQCVWQTVSAGESPKDITRTSSGFRYVIPANSQRPVPGIRRDRSALFTCTCKRILSMGRVFYLLVFNIAIHTSRRES